MSQGSDIDTQYVLEQVAKIAKQAGIIGEIDSESEHFEAGFELPDDRNQMVYVRPTAGSSEDGYVVTLFAPSKTFKKGFFGGIKKSHCIDLLLANEQLSFARYGLWDVEGEYVVVASVDHLLDTLDPPEFEAAIWHVAMAADSFEKKFGGDDF